MNRAYTKGNILIDDKPTNIQKWIDKGGIGILYQANQDSLDYLYNKLNKYYKEQLTWMKMNCITYLKIL